MNVEKIRRIINGYKKEEIHFTPYCQSRMEDRVIKKDVVYSCLYRGEIITVTEQKVMHQGKKRKDIRSATS